MYTFGSTILLSEIIVGLFELELKTVESGLLFQQCICARLKYKLWFASGTVENTKMFVAVSLEQCSRNFLTIPLTLLPQTLIFL